MSGAVHTPGPWEVVKLSGIGGPHSIRMKYSGDKTFYGVRQIHRLEDARLIAAAPELLEALVDVLDSQGAMTNVSEFPNCLNMTEDRGREILALIAKARGAA